MRLLKDGTLYKLYFWAFCYHEHVEFQIPFPTQEIFFLPIQLKSKLVIHYLEDFYGHAKICHLKI